MKIQFLSFTFCIYKLLKLTLVDSACSLGSRTRVLDLKKECKFDFHYLKQEETNIVRIYNAYKKDLQFHRCEIGFRGFNPNNVFTTWNVCFYPIQVGFLSCNISLRFFSGFKKVRKSPKIHFGSQDMKYASWCTENEYGYMMVEVEDPKPCDRMLAMEIEVCATPGVDMTIASCAVIVTSIVTFILVVVACCVRYHRQKNVMDPRTVNTTEQQARPQTDDNFYNSQNGDRSSNRSQPIGNLLTPRERSPHRHNNSPHSHRERSPNRNRQSSDLNVGLPPPSYEECMLSTINGEDEVLPSYDSVKRVETHC